MRRLDPVPQLWSACASPGVGIYSEFSLVQYEISDSRWIPPHILQGEEKRMDQHFSTIASQISLVQCPYTNTNYPFS